MLKLLAKEGSTDQLFACGLQTVGDELRLKEVASLVQVPEIIIRGKKPTLSEVKAMSDLNQRIYKAIQLYKEIFIYIECIRQITRYTYQ